ncbi:hypothetical protein CBR_g32161 [Chara braunii]|uniref:Uncharacterized protein n=1 Tax=Chara braunii TaxID=69332 RepID=A0A388JMW1_CHABU|nr:hypothetical protein CBR_g32161 [Chara braunii]|eukprot:GBG59144.1 hypothetical protein CBR_g32161 [Chara braunii]
MRPGNKRGSVALNTPDVANRGTPKARWTDLGQDGTDKWKSEYRKLQELRRADFAEVEAMKKKHALAASEVLSLQKKMSELSVEDRGADKTGGGTNLKDKMEAAALRSARKGKKATPNRDAVKKTTDRASFIEEQKKQLRLIRKFGLEALCKDIGLNTGKVDPMIDAIAEHRAMQAFGSFARRNIDTVDLESESTQEIDTSKEVDAQGGEGGSRGEKEGGGEEGEEGEEEEGQGDDRGEGEKGGRRRGGEKEREEKEEEEEEEENKSRCFHVM